MPRASSVMSWRLAFGCGQGAGPAFEFAGFLGTNLRARFGICVANEAKVEVEAVARFWVFAIASGGTTGEGVA